MAIADASIACAHCGLPVPAGAVVADGPQQFCCAGCRAVFALVGGLALAGADASADRAYSELDDPGFSTRACRRDPDGLLATDLYLEGVHCAACVWVVEKLPQLVPGVVEARLDLPRAHALIRWDETRVPLSAIARRLASLGFVPHSRRGADVDAARRREDRAALARVGLAGAVAGNVMAIAFALYGGMLHGMEPEFAALFRWASLALTLPSLVWCGGVFFRGAWAALRARTLGMDLPIAIGLVAGFAHGAINTLRGEGEVYFDSVSALIFLLLAGRYLLRRRQRAASDAAELAASLYPSAARVIEGGIAREVPLDAIRAGALVEVRAGDLVPADGVIVAGRSTVDASVLSGEPVPVAVAPGERVHAGTLNVASRLEVRVEETGEDTRVGRLMRLVDEQARRRAPIVQLADRLAGRFTATVLVLAAITFTLWAPVDTGRALDHAVALLIVTCPCALGLATPLAISAAIGQAARAGFLVKGGDVVERLARPGRAWLDKTGTITEGRARLVRWCGDTAVRPLVAAAEAHSAHPLARACVEALGGAPAGAVSIVETHGGGIEAVVSSRAVVIGSPDFVRARAAAPDTALAADVDAMLADGLTPVLIAVDGRVMAAAGFGDAIRADASAALVRLRALGWRLGLLSGDHARVVAATGRAVGIEPDACRGGVAPEGKLEVVAADAARGPVMMVGDGVNDAAALAAATVGVAVHGGAEAALAAADVFVMRPGVSPIADLVEGARRTMHVVRRNLALSLGYNVVGIALAMSGVLNPLVAAILMPLSSLTVIASSYRARTFVPRRRAEAEPWK